MEPEEEQESAGENVDDLMPMVYDRLRDLAGRWFRTQPKDATLQPTALVHEAYLHLCDQPAAAGRDKAQFLALAAAAMRQILIQSARRRGAAKRGGNWQRVELPDDPTAPATRAIDILALDEAIEGLAQLHKRQAQVVEMRFFGGLTMTEIARALGVTTRTVESDWSVARAWLESSLGGSNY